MTKQEIFDILDERRKSLRKQLKTAESIYGANMTFVLKVRITEIGNCMDVLGVGGVRDVEDKI